jgi:NAD(P)-dependent dehydrogenase (short-subunit alcohol dehydrogenase family)
MIESPMTLPELFSLKGKRALITGGSRGLGLQMAEALGEMGAQLILSARHKNELEAAQAHLAARGITAAIIPQDLAQFDTIPQFAAEAGAVYGGLDILINNAGATWGAPAQEHSDEAWLKVINLNVNALFLLTREIGKHYFIPQQSGKIIVTASIAGLRGNPAGMNAIAYNTSKGADINFVRALAAEWGRFNINVNAICPGFFPSKMANGIIEVMGEKLVKATPLRRIGGEDDLKGLVLLLASEAGRHITGQAIAVDGGASCC